MANLPNPFTTSAEAYEPQAETLVVASRSQAPVAAASDPFDSGARPLPDEAAAPFRQTSDAAATFDCLMDDICEIFAGARKLFDPDPAGYTNADQVYYDLLKQWDDPHTADLIDIPAGMWGEFDPAPLFLRQAG